MKKYWLFLTVLALMTLMGYRTEAASPNWLQFCDNANVKTKSELVRYVSEWKNCHLPREMFFARLSGVAGMQIKNLEDFRAYINDPRRELVACDWRKGDVEIDHINRGKEISFGQSWRPCRPSERMLIDWSKPTGNSGRIVLSGWCLNTVHDRRPPIPPPPPPPPPAPAMTPPEKTSPWPPTKPASPEAKPVKVVEEKTRDFVGCTQVDSVAVIQPVDGFGFGYGTGGISFSMTHVGSGPVVQTISQCLRQ